MPVSKKGPMIYMDRIFLILLITLAAILLVLFIVSLLCFKICIVRSKPIDLSREKVTKGTRFEEATPIIKEALKWFEKKEYTKVSITSKDGLRLAGKLIEAENAAGTIILIHGYRSIAVNDFSAALKSYFEKGFTILLIDQRSHGESEGKYITFGIKESEDVSLWAQMVHDKYPGLPIFFSGISMGAATALMATRFDLPEEVKGIVADCGFTSPEDIIRYTIKNEVHLPPKLFYPMINFWCKKPAKCDMSSVSTIDALKGNRIPILLIHGKADTRVPCSMTERNYEACNAYKEMVLVDNADHGMSFLKDRKRLIDILDRFMENCIKNGMEPVRESAEYGRKG